MKLSTIKPNPKNPRFIRDDKFRKLKDSLQTFPKMMALRPIVVDQSNVIQGGNMRFRALKDLGYKDIPDQWVVKAEDLTPEEWRRFVVEDNASFGEWDFDALSAEYDAAELDAFGVDIPSFGEVEEDEPKATDEAEQEGRYLVEVECRDAAQQTELWERLIREGQRAKRIDK